MALAISKGVKSRRDDVTIAVNQEKPRKGAFVISVRGHPIVTLLDLPRPFKRLRDLSVDDSVSDILKALE